MCAALIGHNLFASPSSTDAMLPSYIIVCDEMADRCMCESKARQGDADAKGGCSNGYLQMQMRINRSKLELEKRIACMLSKLCGL